MEYVKDFGAIIALLIYYSIVEYKKIRRVKGKTGRFIENNYLSIEINRILKEIRIITKANRVHILMFRNSSETLRGKCYYYMDMMYEDCDSHTKPILQQYQNIVCSQFADSQAVLHQNGMMYIGENDTTKLGMYNKSIGIKAAYKYRIGGTIANGILAISYYDRDYKMTDKQFDFVKNKLIELETIIKI